MTHRGTVLRSVLDGGLRRTERVPFNPDASATAAMADAFERQRNSLAFRAQGNRNPFVDRPEFVAAVGDGPNN